jgi:hypothetical protein
VPLAEFPRSTARMQSGDYCWIPREDGLFAAFIYLFPRRNSRSYFFGALATSLVPTPEEKRFPGRVDIGPHALLHIKCFKENGTPITGNLTSRLYGPFLEALEIASHRHEVGDVSRVWGWQTIFTEANAIVA